MLGSKGKQRDFVVGTASAGPISDTWDNATWTKFVGAYKAAFKDGFPSPSLFAHGYYVNTQAMIAGLNKTGGETGKKLQEALATLELDTPTGKVKLDKNRNAIADIFLTEVTAGPDGNLLNKIIKVIPQVNQTLGLDEKAFMAGGPVGRDNPDCK